MPTESVTLTDHADVRFYTSTGRLTPFAFACGYIERHETGAWSTTLWREYGAFHVRTHDHAEHRRIEWVVVGTLKDARKAFVSQCAMHPKL